jgi:hypothetical protein
MKTRTVIALSLLLLGLSLLFPERNRSQGEHSESKILPKIDGAASVADQTQRVESSSPLKTPLPDSPKSMQKTAAMLLKASESLETLIQTELTKFGFAQNDIDAAVKEMQSEYLDGDDRVNITRVVDQVSDSVKLDSSKRQELNIAMINVYLDSLQITFDQWTQCLTYRTTKSSECLKDIAQDLSRTVAAGLSGPDWSKEELSLTDPLVDRFVDEGAMKCSEPKENVRIALQLNLLNCPL